MARTELMDKMGLLGPQGTVESLEKMAILVSRDYLVLLVLLETLDLQACLDTRDLLGNREILGYLAPKDREDTEVPLDL